MSHTVEILSVGTELLLGNIANLDAQILSQGLSELGLNVYWHTVVGDNPQRAREAVSLAKERADIIITTGGLGPTCDDLTKNVLAEAFGKSWSMTRTVPLRFPKMRLRHYLEWVLWRAALAINHLINKPYEVRGFRLDSDFLPVSAAGGGKGDLYCEFDDFVILTEVTMSTSSRQEAMEGEPVRRHVSDAVLKYNKPVYGMFIAVRIDTNTAETFRHGIWYAKGDVKQRLDIVPLTLAQYQKYFVAMFQRKQARPEMFRGF